MTDELNSFVVATRRMEVNQPEFPLFQFLNFWIFKESGLSSIEYEKKLRHQ